MFRLTLIAGAVAGLVALSASGYSTSLNWKFDTTGRTGLYTSTGTGTGSNASAVETRMGVASSSSAAAFALLEARVGNDATLDDLNLSTLPCGTLFFLR